MPILYNGHTAIPGFLFFYRLFFNTQTMTARTSVYRLQVAPPLYQFIDQQVLPGTGVSSVSFWRGFDAIVADLAPKNAALLAERDRLQTELDALKIRSYRKIRFFLKLAPMSCSFSY